MERKLTGWHVFGMFGAGFGIIISVNLTLAYNAVATFPGLEVKNSYVASQHFDENRAAQQALKWDVRAFTKHGELVLKIVKDGVPLEAKIISATFGRATHVGEDQIPQFVFDEGAFRAPVQIAPGNWNLRLEAEAADGTRFQQRIIVGGAS
ncbi:MAG: FixH family protein [Aliishimia sp.]